MRQHKRAATQNSFSILTVDDDPIITTTLQAYFQRSGYMVDVENSPTAAIERVREGSYDIMLLDFLMSPICGNEVVERVREFNQDIYIILLTGHKSMAPPIKTIRELDIQGYYEKSDRFDQLELLVESCVKSIRQMRTIKNYKNGLSSMLEEIPRIYKMQSVGEVVEGFLAATSMVLGCTDAFIALDSALLDAKTAGREMLSGSYVINRLGTAFDETDSSVVCSIISEMGQRSSMQEGRALIFPVSGDGGVSIGLLGAEFAQEPTYEQVQLAGAFIKQVSAAISSILLQTIVNEKNTELSAAYDQIRDSYMEMISAMRLMVDARDIYTRGHSDRVSELSVQIAEYMGKDEAYIERLRVAGLFHDIGKLGIPDNILKKDGVLTAEEYEIIKTHSEIGGRILESLPRFGDIVPIVRSHHERYDGHGYPDGIGRSWIPEESRIIAVADAFDAMTSHRHYRRSLGVEKALSEIARSAGAQFDPDIASAFLEMFDVVSSREAILSMVQEAADESKVAEGVSR